MLLLQWPLEKIMRFAQVNDYLQTLATLGALIGLLAVGYEVRQTNRIALAEVSSNSWTNWAVSAVAEIDSGVADTLATAMTDPASLTLADRIRLDKYFDSQIYLHSHDVFSLSELGSGLGLHEWLLDEAARDAPGVFGSAFARAWLEENSDWIDPELYAAIQRGLEGAPIGADLDYYERIDARAKVIESR